ncbi:MAG: AAA family ATPase [Candidatus Limnocylindria bacterium]
MSEVTVRAAFHDEAGAVLFEEVEQDGQRWVRRPDGNGGYIANLEGVRRVLWNLPALRAHLADGRRAGPVYLTEGTSDARALEVHLAEHGLPGVVTTNPFGATTWPEEFTEALTGAAEVIASVDNDEAGQKRAALLKRELGPVVESLRILRTRLEHKGADLRDHLAAGMGLDALVAVTAEADQADEARFELAVRTAREVCALPEPPDSDRLLGPLVVKGCRTIIGAGTGEGKTTFCMALIAAVAEGRELLAWQGRRGRVLVLDLEQGLRSVKHRLREAGLEDSEAVDYALIPEGLALDRNAQHIAEVERILEEGNYDVVALDPHYKAHVGDANAEQETKALMRLLDGWRARYGFALLLPAHTRKIPAEQGSKPRKLTIHDIFGSSALVRGAEVVVGLQLVRPGFSRLYFFKDRDGDDELPVAGDPWGLLFNREEGYRRDPNETAPPRDLEAELREFCADGEWRTKTELQRPKEKGGLGVGDGALEKTLAALVKAEEFEYAEGPPGRSKQAKCWRLRAPGGGSTSPLWDPVESVEPQGEEGGGSTLPRPLKEWERDVEPPSPLPRAAPGRGGLEDGIPF